MVDEKVNEITVGSQKIVLREPMDRKHAEDFASEMKEAIGSEGEWSYSPEILSKIKTIVFNPGKSEVTGEQRQIEELRRSNDLMKNQISDLHNRFEGLSKRSVVVEKVEEAKVEVKKEEVKPEKANESTPEPAKK